MLLAARGLDGGWVVEPDPAAAKKASDEIDASTLGAMRKNLQKRMTFDDAIMAQLTAGLKARNR